MIISVSRFSATEWTLPEVVLSNETGFTLMELLMVIAIISVAMALALPNLMPAIVASEFESTARHLAAYGRGSMAHCALYQKRLTIHVDLNEQEYWAMTVPDPAASLFQMEGEGESDLDKKNAAITDEKAKEKKSFFSSSLSGPKTRKEKEREKRKIAEAFSEFDRFAAANMFDKAENVKHDSGFLDDIGPDLDQIMSDLDEVKIVSEPEEVSDPMLERTNLMGDRFSKEQGIYIQSIEIGNESHSDGEVEISVTPVGLKEKVVFYLTNEDGEYLTIVWDAISGDARIFEGEETSA